MNDNKTMFILILNLNDFGFASKCRYVKKFCGSTFSTIIILKKYISIVNIFLICMHN